MKFKFKKSTEKFIRRMFIIYYTSFLMVMLSFFTFVSIFGALTLYPDYLGITTSLVFICFSYLIFVSLMKLIADSVKEEKEVKEDDRKNKKKTCKA